jgi:hypothetical protein
MMLLYHRCRKEGAHFSLVVFIATIGVLIMAIHWLARPHLFVWLGVYLFYTRLEDFYRGAINHWKMLIPLALYMVLWVNVHPGFIFGLIILAIYLFSCLAQSIVFSNQAKPFLEKAKWIFLAMVACAGAALINPYGFGLFGYIANYLHGSKVLAETGEFLSPVFHGQLQPTCLEILFALLIFGLAFGARRLTLPTVLMCIAFAHLALSGLRNLPLFVIVSLPAIARSWSGFSIGEGQLRFASLRERLTRMTKLFDENEALCNKHIWPIAYCLILVIAAVNGGSLAGQRVLNSSWSPKNKPIATLEYLRTAEKKGELDANRGFNFDNWGGYIRYLLGTRVFIDDRADFYGEKFYYEYGNVSLVQPGWQKILDDHKIQWVLFPKDSLLSAALSKTPGWQNVAQDEASQLFVRK